MNDVKAVSSFVSGFALPSSGHKEVRCAVRFPLSLPVVVLIDGEEMPAVSRNVSASGVLFEIGQTVPVGSAIQFTLRMPGQILGTKHDVLVHCAGRVVRCSLSQNLYLAASTIDEYRFAEQ
ncbi:PilZ domain-containing protein [Telmatobacter bradus]|uniref:PilZ domain-containing protein n=1 Tax=Telmatobacter bradus TaxID=474953 RepID=UPI003B42CDEE